MPKQLLLMRCIHYTFNANLHPPSRAGDAHRNPRTPGGEMVSIHTRPRGRVMRRAQKVLR